MTSYSDPKIRREIIMDHYNTPRHKVEKVNNSIDIYSKACVDELHLELTWDKEILKDARFSGVGCAVFLSSVDLMLDLIITKSKSEIKEIVKNYEAMIEQKGNYDLEVLGKLAVFENVSTHLNRLHCAQMIALALKKI